jgi:hypothetical protein
VSLDARRVVGEQLRHAPRRLAEAQHLLARAHGFPTWSAFARQIEALQSAHTPEARFEAAADAIVAGSLETLRTLFQVAPDLALRRSARDHHSTLLHYVSANGVEDYRQITPGNIVEVAKFLLDAGCDVNAASDAYAGNSTTLELTATSFHPERAGVQEDLMALLLSRGAIVELRPGTIVRACLANGRGSAARFLASHGASIGLAEAAGTGDLELVRRSIGGLAPSEAKVVEGFLWACQFGHLDVVTLLLDHGVDAGLSDRDGMTGLHWAAHNAHLDVIRVLLERGAPLEARNRYGGTVIEGAIWSAMNNRQADHPAAIRLLRAAGAIVPADARTGVPELDAALGPAG